MNSFSKRITEPRRLLDLERQMQALFRSVDTAIKIEIIEKNTPAEIEFAGTGFYRIFVGDTFFDHIPNHREICLAWWAAHILEHHFNKQHELLKHTLAIAVWHAYLCKRARIKAAQEAFNLRAWLLAKMYREDDEDNGILGGFLGSYLLWHEATKFADEPQTGRLELLEYARSKPNLTPFLADHEDIPDFKEKQ